jgi:hypothetical protein
MQTKEMPTTIFGLTKEIKFIQEDLNRLDWVSCDKNYLHDTIEHEFSDKNKSILKQTIESLKNDKFKNVLEIGIARSNVHSSTYYLFENKPTDTIYVGIDMNPVVVQWVKEWNSPNAYSYLRNSGDFDGIKQILEDLKIDELDLLIIDGDHSMNQIYLDFKLASLVRKGGYVFFHDTNYHPGPSAILDCVNENLFEKKKYFEGEEDWGVSTFKKLV